MNQDAEHLRLLAIFHYVYAGLTALFACFPMIYVFIGLAMVGGAFGRGDGAPPAIAGGFLALVGIVAFIFVMAMAALNAYAGKCLADKKYYVFCIVISAINCLSFPFGTALGVFTIVILQRPGVRAMFGKPVTPQT
ncbi:MAG: hypothetical protein H0X66_09050 [Verrucomicrobia bacterium]|nr:hypothetical protein [Verrucomicrobiota bacterium]